MVVWNCKSVSEYQNIYFYLYLNINYLWDGTNIWVFLVQVLLDIPQIWRFLLLWPPSSVERVSRKLFWETILFIKLSEDWFSSPGKWVSVKCSRVIAQVSALYLLISDIWCNKGLCMTECWPITLRICRLLNRLCPQFRNLWMAAPVQTQEKNINDKIGQKAIYRSIQSTAKAREMSIKIWHKNII